MRNQLASKLFWQSKGVDDWLLESVGTSAVLALRFGRCQLCTTLCGWEQKNCILTPVPALLQQMRTVLQIVVDDLQVVPETLSPSVGEQQKAAPPEQVFCYMER
jgi:hypothetical protein